MKVTKPQKRWGIAFSTIAIIAVLALYPPPPEAPVQYVDRDSGVLKTEKAPGEKWLVWLYHNPVGEATLWTLVKRKALSSLYGNMMKRPSSVEKIDPFVKEYDVDMSEAKRREFKSFNDFFTRKLKDNARSVNGDTTVAVSPADGKILAYQNIANCDFIIKGYCFDVASFLNDTILAKNYLEGSLVIVRLAPPDYHRFHFPVGGKASPVNPIDGWYYSVNPIALREKAEIFILNKREYTVISNPLFGDVIMAEIGATMVGSIVQIYTGNSVKKGEEKGYFEFGGSSVALLFGKNQIRIDADLLENTGKGYETSVKMGEQIGVAWQAP